MSEENVGLLRGLYEEWGKGNLSPGPEHYSPDAIFHTPAAGGGELDREAFRRFMREFVEQWDGFRMEAQEFLDLGDTVIVTERQYATGKLSGVESEQAFYTVWTFRDGLITGARWELDMAAAKRTAGASG
jgi:ketosteroid isomerase-like protein